MTLQEKIKKKAEGYGILSPEFIEGAKFALENQWISVDEDLPCNHEELIIDNPLYKRTKPVVCNKPCGIRVDQMVYDMSLNGWYWTGETPTHWFPAPELPKEQEIKLWKEKKKDNCIDKNRHSKES